MRRAPLLLLLIALPAAPVPAASAYQCTATDGSVSFQDQPCRPAARQRRLSLPDDPPAAAPAPAAAPSGEPAGPQPATAAAQRPPRPAPPSFFICVRPDGSRYRNATGRGGGAAVPYAMLDDALPLRGTPPRPGRAPAPAPGAAALAGAYVWVEDRCHRAAPREACGYLQGELDALLGRIRSASMNDEPPLEREADALRESLRGC